MRFMCNLLDKLKLCSQSSNLVLTVGLLCRTQEAYKNTASHKPAELLISPYSMLRKWESYYMAYRAWQIHKCDIIACRPNRIYEIQGCTGCCQDLERRNTARFSDVRVRVVQKNSTANCHVCFSAWNSTSRQFEVRLTQGGTTRHNINADQQHCH